MDCTLSCHASTQLSTVSSMYHQQYLQFPTRENISHKFISSYVPIQICGNLNKEHPSKIRDVTLPQLPDRESPQINQVKVIMNGTSQSAQPSTDCSVIFFRTLSRTSSDVSHGITPTALVLPSMNEILQIMGLRCRMLCNYIRSQLTKIRYLQKSIPPYFSLLNYCLIELNQMATSICVCYNTCTSKDMIVLIIQSSQLQ